MTKQKKLSACCKAPVFTEIKGFDLIINYRCSDCMQRCELVKENLTTEPERTPQNNQLPKCYNAPSEELTDALSLCSACYCMTKSVCGKCKAVKQVQNESNTGSIEPEQDCEKEFSYHFSWIDERGNLCNEDNDIENDGLDAIKDFIRTLRQKKEAEHEKELYKKIHEIVDDAANLCANEIEKLKQQHKIELDKLVQRLTQLDDKITKDLKQQHKEELDKLWEIAGKRMAEDQKIRKQQHREELESLRLNKRYPIKHSNYDSKLLCTGWNQAVDEINTKIEELLNSQEGK